MAYVALPTRSSSDPNAAADINQLQENTSEAKRSRFYQIDGDGNGNQTESTSQSTSGYKVLDMWYFSQSGADSLSLVAHSTSNSKPNFIRINGVSSNANTGIWQRIHGNILSNKNLSSFFRMKYSTNIPSSLQIRLVGESSGVREIITTPTLTNNWVWFRVDIPSTALTGSYNTFEIRNPNAETWDLDIDKIRIIETGNLEDGIIPEWVKQDEDREEMKLKILSYYERVKGTTGNQFVGICNGYAASDTQADCTLRFFPKIRIPTINDFSNLRITFLLNAVVVSGMSVTNLSECCALASFTCASALTAGHGVGVGSNTVGAYLDINARY